MAKKTEAEEHGISNRPIYPIFVPPLANAPARESFRRSELAWISG